MDDSNVYFGLGNRLLDHSILRDWSEVSTMYVVYEKLNVRTYKFLVHDEELYSTAIKYKEISYVDNGHLQYTSDEGDFVVKEKTCNMKK